MARKRKLRKAGLLGNKPSVEVPAPAAAPKQTPVVEVVEEAEEIEGVEEVETPVKKRRKKGLFG
jgi:hypothetical protein|tara:strand:- start:3625 stop:3816 length:192 start_codon:yes stop_codon:yes gene_type:complete